MNRTLKTILLAVLIVILGAAVNAFIKRSTSKNTSPLSAEQIISQEVSKMKRECPIKIDDITSLVDVKFEQDKKKIIYSFKIENDDGFIYSPVNIAAAKAVISVDLCHSYINKLPAGYGAEFLYLNKVNKNIMDIFLDRDICANPKGTRPATHK